MHNSDALPDKHTAHQRETVEAGGGCGLVVHHLQGQVVYLQAIGQVPDTLPPAVGVSDNYHLVPLFNQALGELVNVTFYSSHVWIEKVRHHADVVLPAVDSGSLCRNSRVSLR